MASERFQSCMSKNSLNSFQVEATVNAFQKTINRIFITPIRWWLVVLRKYHSKRGSRLLLC